MVYVAEVTTGRNTLNMFMAGELSNHGTESFRTRPWSIDGEADTQLFQGVEFSGMVGSYRT